MKHIELPEELRAPQLGDQLDVELQQTLAERAARCYQHTGGLADYFYGAITEFILANSSHRYKFKDGSVLAIVLGSRYALIEL